MSSQVPHRKSHQPPTHDYRIETGTTSSASPLRPQSSHPLNDNTKQSEHAVVQHPSTRNMEYREEARRGRGPETPIRLSTGGTSHISQKSDGDYSPKSSRFGDSWSSKTTQATSMSTFSNPSSPQPINRQRELTSNRDRVGKITPEGKDKSPGPAQQRQPERYTPAIFTGQSDHGKKVREDTIRDDPLPISSASRDNGPQIFDVSDEDDDLCCGESEDSYSTESQDPDSAKNSLVAIWSQLKRNAIDRLLLDHDSVLNGNSGIIVHAAGGQEGERRRTTVATANREARKSQPGILRQKRRYNDEDSDLPEDDQGDRRKKARCPSVGNTPTGGMKRFACHFYKRSPDRYKHEQACTGPGFLNIERVKEHLDRRHKRPIQCPRCWDIYTSQVNLATHLEADRRCDRISENLQREGITDEQMRRLKSRPSFRGATTPEEKWTIIWQILFPEDVILPSPYFVHPRSHLSPSEEFDDREDYQKREQARLLRMRIEQELQSKLGPEMAEIAERLETMSQECYEMAAENFLKLRPEPLHRWGSFGAEAACLLEETYRLESGLVLANYDIPPETGGQLLGFPKALAGENNEKPSSNPDPDYGPFYPESRMPDAPRSDSTPSAGSFWQLPGVPPEQSDNYQPMETVLPPLPTLGDGILDLDLAHLDMGELTGEEFDINQYLIGA